MLSNSIDERLPLSPNRGSRRGCDSSVAGPGRQVPHTGFREPVQELASNGAAGIREELRVRAGERAETRAILLNLLEEERAVERRTVTVRVQLEVDSRSRQPRHPTVVRGS
jgi:hypothetical protein